MSDVAVLTLMVAAFLGGALCVLAMGLATLAGKDEAARNADAG